MTRRLTLLVGGAIVASLQALIAQTPAQGRLSLELADYAQMPITGAFEGSNTLGQLARVNFLREEPGGRRFFVNDLNGPLYILDKQTKRFTTYLDFKALFPRLIVVPGFASGLVNVQFDPDYARNGVFYTVHIELATAADSPMPKAGVVPGLDLSSYATTPPIAAPGASTQREGVIVEWTDSNPTNTTFEGTARELLRLQFNLHIHPLGEMTFNPTARENDPDWRVMYVGVGDTGSGEQRDSRQMNPQRLDTLVGKILRIVPDLRAHTATSTVSDNGRYRIPNDNPFVSVEGARKEIWAAGLRNPHRMSWDVDPDGRAAPRLFAFNIGLATWETVMIVHRGANYGYPLREGAQLMTPEHRMLPPPADDTVPVQISDTVVRGAVRPTYPVVAYPHARENGGDAIAGGFVYRGKKFPALQRKLVFGDMTTGRIWYAELAEVIAADDDKPETLATPHEIDTKLRQLVEETYRARGGKGPTLPGSAGVSGPRVDMRFAVDSDGEIYVLTKSDGMIRRVAAVR